MLRLTLVRCPPEQGADTSRDLLRGQITIGRASDNDWVMRDQDRALSKNHCIIEARGGAYVVVDTSTNGVFVNGGAEPVGRGNAVVINDGDRIAFGDFVVEASVGADQGGSVPLDMRPSRSFDPAPFDDVPFDQVAPFDPGPHPTIEVMPVPPDDDRFGPGRSMGDPWQSLPSRGWDVAGESDHSPVERDAMVLPPREPSSSAAIPDDWDVDTSAAAVGTGSAIPDDWDDDLSAPTPDAAPEGSWSPADEPPVAAPVTDPRTLAVLLAEALLALERVRRRADPGHTGRPPSAPPPVGAIDQALDGEDMLARLEALGAHGATAAVRALIRRIADSIGTSGSPADRLDGE